MAGERRLPWDGFSDWLHAICVVTFDLELGQALEVVYPGHVKLTEAEKTNLCYLAFPDSNSGCMGDTVFHFRMRRLSTPVSRPSNAVYNRACPPSLALHPGYFYGFVYFRQVSDKSIRRGYLQKSVVILSQLPLTRLFRHLVQVIAPEYFANGEPGLEAACHDMDQWPTPVPGRSLSLPLMGRLIHIRIPSRFDPPNPQHSKVSQPSEASTSTLLPSVHEPDLYESFSAFLPHLQLLWELVLLGEPLVVMAPSPTLSSNVVQSLVSLIWPLQYSLDYRPFFTIHDSEFSEYTSRSQPPPKVILGVTNPFFCKTLDHWPHILRLRGGDGGSPRVSQQKLQKTADMRSGESKAGVYTQYKPFIGKDKLLLKRLQKGAESMRPAEVQSLIIRRHFMELTQSLMIPLERYLASLMPLQKQISPFKAPPSPRAFQMEEFMASLDMNGPQLTSGLKGDWVGLYKAFLSTENANVWLRGRLEEVGEKLEVLHLESICSARLDKEILGGREELELVDLLLKLRDKEAFLDRHAERLKLSNDFRQKLSDQKDAVLEALSPDLRDSLLIPRNLSLPRRSQSPATSIS